MYFLVKYATQTTVYFPMVKRDVVDLALSADWTPATGDCKISIDGGNDANTTNLPAAVASTAALWALTLTAAELTGKLISVRIIDTATKAVEDQALFFQTFGHASASIVRDVSTDPATANVTQWAGSAVATPDTAGYPKITVKAGTGTGELSLSSGVVAADAVKISTDATAADTLESLLDGGGGTLTANITGNITGNLSGSVGSVTGAVGSVAGNVDGNVTGSVGSVTTVSDKTGYRLSATGVGDILTTTLTEGYAADGATFTIEQALYMIWAFMAEKSISGTTMTVKKLDGTTTAMTFTLNDGTSPTSISRS